MLPVRVRSPALTGTGCEAALGAPEETDTGESVSTRPCHCFCGRCPRAGARVSAAVGRGEEAGEEIEDVLAVDRAVAVEVAGAGEEGVDEVEEVLSVDIAAAVPVAGA